MNIAIIPARGGSKRIPRKNIKLFHGKPMIAWSILAAKQAGCFERIIVSTDDAEIAAVAQKYGAEVPFVRPAEIANDYATTGDVISHAISWLIEQRQTPEQVCCLYATAPFVEPEDLCLGLRLLTTNSECQFAFSATRFGFPIQRAIKLDASGQVIMFSPEYLLTRSQDLEEAYHDAGQFYWGRTSAWLNKAPIFAAYSKLVLLPNFRVQDIDTPEDWLRAERLFALKER
ncbi:pseudaminic acid cytidylyltransferase [Aeromonas salmonicida]|uniref:pseudaminic acid cytidylyltransferase n=1 Tax=Aeromonas salmonicida TaxID=645 RepID=UPI001F1FFB85|nr:pseudaminic acid cytidylyltransferase [Aeromonas salmonicida]MCE9936645.1 pseudaminic acid cytidylyltransferase [Aeromonas salmonicida]